MARRIAVPLPQPLAAFEAPRVAKVALQAFFKLASEWDISRDEQVALLGAPSVRTFYRWKAGEVAALPRDTLERISVLLGVYKALHILLPDAGRANAWIKRANKAFGGATALEVMLRGRVDDLYSVRRYLDAWRG